MRITVLSGEDGDYCLPVIASSEDAVKKGDGYILLRDMLTISADHTVRLSPSNGKRFFHQVGEFQYVQLHFPVKNSLYQEDSYPYFVGYVLATYCIEHNGGIAPLMRAYCDYLKTPEIYGVTLEELTVQAVRHNTALFYQGAE